MISNNEYVYDRVIDHHCREREYTTDQIILTMSHVKYIRREEEEDGDE